jgi:nucleotide-binding universal stress UspA family protein
MYQRMLVPLDGSELSEAVFPYAKELAGRLGMDVILLHVHSPEESGTIPLHRAYIEHKAVLVKRESQEVQDKVGGRAGGREIKVWGELAVGYPAEEILRFAAEKDTDLILMATHGRSGIKRWVMGSVADKVLRASRVPVWLVRAGIPEGIVYDKWPKRTILVPLDGSELAEAVLPHVEALAKQQSAELVEVVLLRVCEAGGASGYYPPSARFETPTGAVHVMPRDFARATAAKQKMLAKQYLTGIAKQLRDAGLKVRTEVCVGDPAGEIIAYTSSSPFNLIVMATHARSGLSRWAYGSVATKVLQGVSSPMFLVRTSGSESA